MTPSSTQTLLVILLCGCLGCDARRSRAAYQLIEATMKEQRNNTNITSLMAGASRSAMESYTINKAPTFEQLKAKIDCWEHWKLENQIETATCPNNHNFQFPLEIYDGTGNRNSDASSGEMRMDVQFTNAALIHWDVYYEVMVKEHPKVGYSVRVGSARADNFDPELEEAIRLNLHNLNQGQYPTGIDYDSSDSVYLQEPSDGSVEIPDFVEQYDPNFEEQYESFVQQAIGKMGGQLAVAFSNLASAGQLKLAKSYAQQVLGENLWPTLPGSSGYYDQKFQDLANMLQVVQVTSIEIIGRSLGGEVQAAARANYVLHKLVESGFSSADAKKVKITTSQGEHVSIKVVFAKKSAASASDASLSLPLNRRVKRVQQDAVVAASVAPANSHASGKWYDIRFTLIILSILQYALLV